MIDMKCPICGNDLERYHTGLVCYRHCLNGKNVWGSEGTLKELDHTRKALDIAINVLNRVKDVKYEEYIDEKLEQINEITKGGNNE